MKYISIIACIFLASCASAKSKKEDSDVDTTRTLHFMDSYKTKTDSIAGAVISYYDKIGLRKEQNGTGFQLLLNNNTVFKGDAGKYHYLFEVFNDSYLLISYVHGISGAAGPDLFERDSIIIIDLGKGTVKNTSLTGVHLTRSAEVLNKNFPHISKAELDKRKKSYYAITDIDFQNNVMKLYNQVHTVQEFKIY